VCLLFDIFLPSPFHEIILTSVRKEGSRSLAHLLHVVEELKKHDLGRVATNTKVAKCCNR
jgi:hypothetical protein